MPVGSLRAPWSRGMGYSIASSSHPVASHPSRPCYPSCVAVPLPAIVRAFELLKTARLDNPSVSCPHLIHLIVSFASFVSFFSPSIDTGGGAFFSACRLAVGAARSSLSSCGLRRLVVLPSRCYCPRVGSSCPLVVLGFSCVVFVPPRHAVVRGAYRLIAFRPVLPIRRAGSGRCPLLAAWSGAVSSCPHDVVSSRAVHAVGRAACLVLFLPFSPAGVVGVPSSIHRHVGRFFFLLCRCRVLLSSSSRFFSCRAAARFVSLRHSPRLATRRAGSSRCPLLAVRVGGVSCSHGVVSSRSWLIGMACCLFCVDCVAWAGVCRFYGILVLSISCIYRLIGFLICPVCLMLPLSVSSAC